MNSGDYDIMYYMASHFMSLAPNINNQNDTPSSSLLSIYTTVSSGYLRANMPSAFMGKVNL
jgi:hypothetical protein